MNTRISIIIVSFCTRDLLRNCLASIRNHGLSGLEVIVVDNDSSDRSREMVRCEFPEVQLIENSKNVGFAGANNEGIRRARGKYLLLLNSDTVVRGRAIEDMAD